MALIREDDVDAAEPRRRASVADGVDLRRLALGIPRGAVLPPISRPGRAIAGLPEIRSPRLVAHARNHAALLGALDLPECIAAELDVISLLIDRVAPAPVDE